MLTGQKDKIEILEILIDKGGNLNTTLNSSSNKTHLNFAIIKGNQDIISLILEKGADVNLIDNDGWTPLNLAIDKDKIEIVQFLVANGANLNLFDGAGLSPLSSGRI